MSDEIDEDDGGETSEGEGAAAAEGKKKGGLKKKLLLFGLPAAILLLGGAGAAMMFMGGGEDDEHHVAEGGHGEAAAHAEEHAYIFYDLPELLVNINGGDGRTAYLKLKLNIEVADESMIPVLDANMPRVIDRFQGFLRELRPEDLSGSSGYYRLKLELLRRVNLSIAPAEAEAVNIDQMLIQ